MAGFYPTSSAQADALSASYIQDQKFVSYSDSPIINGNMMMYLNPASSTGSFSEISPGNSMSNITGRNEMMFIPPTGDSMSMQNISGQLNTRTSENAPNSVAEEFHLASSSQLGGERNLHGLSLSLSTQMSTAVPPNSYQHQFYNSGLSPVLTTHLPLGGENSCRPVTGKVDEASHSKDLRNSGYGSYELQGEGQNSIRFGAPSHLQYMVSPKTGGFNAYQYEQGGNASSVLKSKYLKAAQLLLDEVVNVREALKQHESGRDENNNNNNNNNKVEEGSTESKEKQMGTSDVNDSTAASTQEISAAERQDLQAKLDKLLAMLDEVDRRYKQYFHQMQILVSSFDMVAGCGAAKPYTTLALKTISRHFRCLRDAISGQIQATRKSLGEQDLGPGGVIPRLRYVDQQIRQQRALQQFGMMRHAWRPQRGLPENAVTVLRAWLFEHFLHPYPKDSEKTMLARQTGLTRGQVANWFINARVRLWKPMVEEMYKEEFGDGDLNSKSSPENASKTAGEKSWASEDRREDLQESIASMADSGHPGATHDDSKANMNYHAAEMDRFAGRTGMIMGFHQGDDKHRDQMKSHVDAQQQQPYLDSHSFYPHDQNALMGYQVPEPGGYAMNNQVSLALGLRRVEGDGGDVSNGPTENNGIGPGSADYAYLDSVNQQQRFGNSHLLNDFVV